MWRTVIITKGERITIKDNWLVVYSESDEQRVPIGDLYSVIIDNRAAMLSTAVLTTLAMVNVHINDGYIMLQYSVYSKTVRNYDDARKHCRYLQCFVPPEGSVRAMTVTEKQYASMELLVGEKLKSENLLDSRDIIEL